MALKGLRPHSPLPEIFMSLKIQKFCSHDLHNMMSLKISISSSHYLHVSESPTILLAWSTCLWRIFLHMSLKTQQFCSCEQHISEDLNIILPLSIRLWRRNIPLSVIYMLLMTPQSPYQDTHVSPNPTNRSQYLNPVQSYDLRLFSVNFVT